MSQSIKETRHETSSLYNLKTTESDYALNNNTLKGFRTNHSIRLSESPVKSSIFDQKAALEGSVIQESF